MSTPGWRTSLVVQGVELSHGHQVPVVVGLIESAAGGVQIALRVGENGDPVILPLQAASQLIVNLRETLGERLKITAEVVGDDES